MTEKLPNPELLEYLASVVASSKTQPNSTLNFDNLLEMVESITLNQTIYDTEPFTKTIEDQLSVEMDVQEIYDDVLETGSNNFPSLKREAHQMYANMFLQRQLPSGFSALDASHPWILYWLLNARVLMGEPVSKELGSKIDKTILACIDENTGAIGGGEYQLGHLASTYAGLLALALSGSTDAISKLDRKKIYRWLLSLKQEDGSFVMHHNGEVDTRAVYCALCIASLLNILDDQLTRGTSEWIGSCQTYEGGFGGIPGDEAHGGYTFCAIAALCILDSPLNLRNHVDLDNLVNWTVKRQYALEGGLSGRTNKLVDGCYSHWVGGLTPILEIAIDHKRVIDRMKLQNYILCCCQDDQFGLRDKPGKNPDFYHTNYVICGLSMCQNYQTYDLKSADVSKLGTAYGFTPVKIEDKDVVDNLPANSLAPLDPIFGLPSGVAKSLCEFFVNLDNELSSSR
ncbi:hypothetical protein CANARDRAFT_28715 [[Candida] arabinofermentans NRRL YB-2248]|uniref:Protein farnesyltransferase subunit beta n=1 Tax=[Candida] arabinofermentans NRRL YB-2248 TaxID=983967 RepID=A0A1E4SZQ2_9ASCO|nr:hypothetical protein CANARDRAFT_28715 [[Candida] arabinofermentans NRRL YB-2248]